MAHDPIYYSLVESLQEPGCAICRVTKYKVHGYLDALLYENVNDSGTRVMLRGAHGLCLPHLRAALARARARLGWRVYAINQPAEQLSVSQAVLAYRHEYLIERGFGRLKGKPLSLTPMYLQDDDHATGLIRLLSIGVRVLTLVEGVVRRRLAEQKEHLARLYAGNPKRKTASPTAELLLEAFQEITLTVVTIGEQVKRHLTPLSPVQQQILTLLDFSSDVYTKVPADSLEPT